MVPSLRVVVCSPVCLRSNARGWRESIEGARVVYMFLDVDKPPAFLPLLRSGQPPFAVVATCFASVVVVAGGVMPSRG